MLCSWWRVLCLVLCCALFLGGSGVAAALLRHNGGHAGGKHAHNQRHKRRGGAQSRGRPGDGSPGGPSFELDLTRTNQNWYYATVSIEGEEVKLAVDTASNDLWVTNAKGPMPDEDKPTLTPRPFQVHYGRGRVAGQVQAASFELPGVKEECDVGVADDEDPWWQNQTSIDGLWGLSCEAGIADGLAAFGPRRLVGCLKQDNKLQKKTIALQLGVEGGTLSIGGIPADLDKRLVMMPKMERCDHWQVPLVSIGIRDRPGVSTPAPKAKDDDEDPFKGSWKSFSQYLQVDPIDMADSATQGPGAFKDFPHLGEWAMLDTGATGIVGPAAEVEPLAERMGASAADAHGTLQSYTIPCSQKDSMPDMRLTIGSAEQPLSVQIQRDDLLRGCDGAPGDQCRCYLALSGWQTKSWILGGSFLRATGGIAFDFENGAVGVAPGTAADADNAASAPAI